MKRHFAILAFALASCAVPLEETTSEECCMPAPLDEFMNSPRRWRNNDESEVVSSGLTILGPGLVASRPQTSAGEPSFVTISAPDLGAIADHETRIQALENTIELLLSVIRFGGENNENTQIWPAKEGGFVQIYAFNGQQIMSAGDANPTAVLGFFGANPTGQTTFTGDWNNGSPSDAVLIDTVGRLAKDLSSASGLGLFVDDRTNL